LSIIAEPIESTNLVGGIEAKTPKRLFFERLRKDRGALFGAALVMLVVTSAALAGVISDHVVDHGPNQLFQARTLNEFGLPKGPDDEFFFGADLQGRDLLVRVLYGTRTSLLVGVATTALAVTLGIVLGIVAGYFGGWVDTVVSRITDIFLALPLLLIAIGIMAACGTTTRGCLNGVLQPGLRLVVLVIALFSWPYIARIVRGNTLAIREREFIEAARSLGASDLWIISREVLPNLVVPIVIYTTLLIPSNIIFEAMLSFLGVGIPDETPSWGGMLKDAAGVLDVAWWLMFFPGLFLLATTLGFNLLGDGLRDALDPKSYR
jgi:peptide/nickel transport system permease protein